MLVGFGAVLLDVFAALIHLRDCISGERLSFSGGGLIPLERRLVALLDSFSIIVEVCERKGCILVACQCGFLKPDCRLFFVYIRSESVAVALAYAIPDVAVHLLAHSRLNCVPTLEGSSVVVLRQLGVLLSELVCGIELCESVEGEDVVSFRK